ncbi:MAG: glycosyltransferase family 4 protein [Sulfitobacter sp.]
MIRIGWFSPISSKTGIATYTAQVLEAMKAQFPPDELDVIVFHPPFEGDRVEMPYPTIALSDSLLGSEFAALFDVAVYHLGNNSLHHALIYAALMRHPGLVVLHDHVYQHYLTWESLQGDHVGPSYVTLVESAAQGSFRVIRASGVMQADKGAVSFVPWESEWAAQVPMGEVFANMGLGTVVHSDYARSALSGDWRTGEDILKLFMTRPDVKDPTPPLSGGGRICIGCCGHIGSTKGLDQLLNAFIKEPDLRQSFRIIIAGFGSDPTYLAMLRRHIAEARLDGVFELRIDPTDAEYHAVMAASDIFFNLRYPNTEGASLSLMEQLAYGRPVIAYRTGSFAEMPEDACYFLDAIGDDQALAVLLQDIAAKPGDVIRKGKAARACVMEKTPAEYARRFVAHVRQNLPAYHRRTALVAARQNDKLPEPGADRDWLDAYLVAYRQLQDFYADRLYLPRNFATMPDPDKGDFVLANLLGIAGDSDAVEQVGGALSALSTVALYDVLGKLLVIQSLLRNRDGLIKPHLKPIGLPVTDRRVWQLIQSFPPRAAISFGLSALNIPYTVDVLEDLTKSVKKSGFKIALRNYLFHAGQTRWGALEGTQLAAYFEGVSNEEVAALPAVTLGSDILAQARKVPNEPVLLLENFYALEDIGMWSNAKRSKVYAMVSDSSVLHGVSGQMALLPPGLEAGEKVRVSVKEVMTGRSVTTKIRFAAGDILGLWWTLDLPGFAGPLQISFEVDALYSPAECDLSADARNLGCLLGSIILSEGAPAPENPPAAAGTEEPDTVPADPDSLSADALEETGEDTADQVAEK